MRRVEGASTLMWRGKGCSKKTLGWEGGIWEILVVLQLLFNFSYYRLCLKVLLFTTESNNSSRFSSLRWSFGYCLQTSVVYNSVPLLIMELKNPLWHCRNHCNNNGLSQENEFSFKFPKKDCFKKHSNAKMNKTEWSRSYNHACDTLLTCNSNRSWHWFRAWVRHQVHSRKWGKM